MRVKLIKNTKGYGWEVPVSEKDADEGLDLLREVETRVKEAFGETEI